MKYKELREKSIEDLNTELLRLLHEKLNLRVQTTSNRIKKTHLIKKIRRDIARVKTLLIEKVKC